MADIHRQAWEATAQEKFPHLSKEEAIKAYRAELGARSKGNKGNPNPPLKNNPELAKELGRAGANKRWGKTN